MTGGRLAAMRRYLDGDDLHAVTYGDGVADVDSRALVAFHQRARQARHGHRGAPAGPLRRAGVRRRPRSREFNEKPQTAEGWINGGFFVFERGGSSTTSRGDAAPCSSASRCERLARDGQLAAYRHDGFWQCMDTLREYNDARTSSGQQASAPWKVWR